MAQDYNTHCGSSAGKYSRSSDCIPKLIASVTEHLIVACVEHSRRACNRWLNFSFKPHFKAPLKPPSSPLQAPLEKLPLSPLKAPLKAPLKPPFKALRRSPLTAQWGVRSPKPAPLCLDCKLPAFINRSRGLPTPPASALTSTVLWSSGLLGQTFHSTYMKWCK